MRGRQREETARDPVARSTVTSRRRSCQGRSRLPPIPPCAAADDEVTGDAELQRRGGAEAFSWTEEYRHLPPSPSPLFSLPLRAPAVSAGDDACAGDDERLDRGASRAAVLRLVGGHEPTRRGARTIGLTCEVPLRMVRRGTSGEPKRRSHAHSEIATLALLLSSTLMTTGGVDARGNGGQSRPQTGQATCNYPNSDAEGLEILSNYYPGYWWDHTDLTIVVQAHPSATSAQLTAIDDAIDTWSDVLLDCFDGLITLTNVTGGKRQAADIVLHFVPTAGGVVFGGYALCGDHKCPNILVRSDLPPSLDREPYTPEYIGWVTLHDSATCSVSGMPRTCWRART